MNLISVIISYQHKQLTLNIIPTADLNYNLMMSLSFTALRQTPSLAPSWIALIAFSCLFLPLGILILGLRCYHGRWPCTGKTKRSRSSRRYRGEQEVVVPPLSLYQGRRYIRSPVDMYYDQAYLPRVEHGQQRPVSSTSFYRARPLPPPPPTGHTLLPMGRALPSAGQAPPPGLPGIDYGNGVEAGSSRAWNQFSRNTEGDLGNSSSTASYKQRWYPGYKSVYSPV